MPRRHGLLGGLLAALCISPDALAAGDALEFERLSIDQGLVQSSVLAALQDRHGFLWLATRGGLNRFDGHSFDVFKHRPEDSSSLSDNSVYVLFEDRSGVLWVGTFNGLDRFDPRTRRFSHLRHDPSTPDSLSHPHVTAITEDEAATLWIGTRGGLHRFAPATGHLTRYLHDPSDPGSLGDDDVTALAHDRLGTLWVGTNGGLFRLDAENGSFVALAEERVGALLLDGSGQLWIGTAGGLARFDAPTGHVVPLELSGGVSEPDVRALFRDDSGRLWLGTGFEGLLVFDPATGETRRYRHDPDDPKSLSSNRVSALFEDATGVLWIATLGGGLNKIVPNITGVERRRTSGGPVRALLTDRAGSLWVGSEQGLGRFDRQSWESLSVEPEELARAHVTALCEDHDGDLWVGTRDAGLGRLEAATGRWVRHAHDEGAGSLSHDTVTALFVDRANDLWVGTQGGLERLVKETGRFVHYRHDPRDPASLSNDLVHAVDQDRQGRIWVATYVGLNRLDRASGRFTRYLRDPGDPASLSDSRIWSVHGDETGRLWIGTSGGLHLFDAGSERFIRYTRGDERDVVYGILGTGRGPLWLSTDSGILELDPVTGRFFDRHPEGGPAAGELLPRAHHESVEGELFFGTSDGFAHFRPAQLRKAQHSPAVVLTGFKRLDQEVAFESLTSEVEELSLSYWDRLVTFELALLDFADPTAHRFSYKLEGWHADWIDNGMRRQVTLTGLAGGDYVFRARGSADGGDWSESELAVRVVVAPPFWQAAWFRTLSLGTLLTLGLMAYGIRSRRARERRRRLEEHNASLQEEVRRRMEAEEEKKKIIAELELRNAEIERFAYTVSHDLKNPLFTIEGFLGLLEQDVRSGDSQRVADDVRRIRVASRRMSDLLEQLLEISRIGRVVHAPEAASLDELAREAALEVQDRLEERGVELVVGPALPTVRGDRLRLLEVLQILLDNAVRFLGEESAPRIEIGHRRGANGDGILYVRDNGVGIDPAYHEKIFGLFERLDANGEGTGVGLAIAKRVIELHGGRIWVESAGLGEGTTVCFTLPELARQEDRSG